MESGNIFSGIKLLQESLVPRAQTLPQHHPALSAGWKLGWKDLIWARRRAETANETAHPWCVN